MELREACEAIASMRVRGAARIGTTAAHALAAHVAAVPGGLPDVQRSARQAAEALESTRPTAVSLHHAVAHVMQVVLEAPDADAAREAAPRAAAAWAARIEQAREQLVRHALALVPAEARILTHCHSSTVVDVLVAAHRRGLAPRVVTTETRPFGQGRITSALLAEAGVHVTFVVDSAADAVLGEGIDGVLVGADTVARDGTLFNKVGTAGVARLARDHGVPFHSLTTSEKFHRLPAHDVRVEERPTEEVWPDAPRGVRIHNPVFDRTPPGLVRGYATEHGVLPPPQAVARALETLPPDWR